MEYATLVFYVKINNPEFIENGNLNSHESSTFERLKQIKNVLTLQNKRPDLKKKTRGDEFELFMGVFQLLDAHYDNKMVNQSQDSLLDQYLISADQKPYPKDRAITSNYPRGISRTPQYIANAKNASKFNKFIKTNLAEMKTKHITITKENFIDYCLSKYPETTYKLDELDLLVELYKFAHTKNTFILRYRSNHHKTPRTETITYIELADLINSDKKTTTRQRFFMSELVSRSSIQGMSYKKANHFLKYSYDQSLLSLWDENYIKSSIGSSIKLKDFFDTIDKMINLLKK